MQYKPQLLILFFLFSFTVTYCQSFEGVLKMYNLHEGVERNTVLTIKGNKSLLEVTVDSVDISILKNEDDFTTTLLKSKDGMHYGFRMDQMIDPSFIESGAPTHATTVNYTGENKRVGAWDCMEIIVSDGTSSVKALVTKQPAYRLSTLFPEFLGSDLSPEMYYIRKAADQEGFILRLEEVTGSPDAVSVMEISLEPQPVSDIVFTVGAEYTVLDKTGVQKYFQQAQSDETAKKKWNEFSALFGSH
jgi:hypothetical protein